MSKELTMSYEIDLFNLKGGVSNTTSTIHMG